MELPFAEDTQYWQTGKSSPDTWIECARKLITELGGTIQAEAFGQDAQGRAAYMLGFTVGDEHFRVVWPVLTPRKGNVKAARIQAATMLYHHVKAACMSSVVLGGRAAFFAHMMLPDGRTAGQVATPELAEMEPELGMGKQRLLGAGDAS